MKALIWSKPSCSYCHQSKVLLKLKGIEYEERVIGEGYTKEQLLESVPSAVSVPQIFIDDEYIGGFNELKKYLEENTNV